MRKHPNFYTIHNLEGFSMRPSLFIDKKFCRENRAGKEKALCIGAPVACDAYRLHKLMPRIAFVQQITDFLGSAGCFTPFPDSYITPLCNLGQISGDVLI